MNVRFQRAPIAWGLLPLVIAGGTVGAFARGLLTIPFPHPLDAIPAVMAINLAGAALLGFVVGRIGDRTRMRTFFGAGVLGGFTSYSALAPWLAVEGANLANAAAHGSVLTLVLGALALLLVALVFPVAAAAGGLVAGIRMRRGPSA